MSYDPCFEGMSMRREYYGDGEPERDSWLYSGYWDIVVLFGAGSVGFWYD